MWTRASSPTAWSGDLLRDTTDVLREVINTTDVLREVINTTDVLREVFNSIDNHHLLLIMSATGTAQNNPDPLSGT
jgi:hypothetical protein